MTDDALDGTVAWRDLLTETQARLERSGVGADPRVEARWIVEDILGVTGAEYHDLLDSLATVRGVTKLDRMVDRRVAGEPIQYVLGHWAFRSLDLLVDDRVLIPRPETEVVAGIAIDELRRNDPDGGVAIDLGTGSGAIGLSIATECPGASVVLTDASDDALAVARANLAGLGMAAASVEIHAGSWFDAVPERFRGTCDVIVSNPPYVTDAAVLPASVAEWEPASALRAGSDGLDDLRILVAEAADWLKPGGVVVLEMDPEQTQPVIDLAASHGWEGTTHRDLAGRDRAVVLRRSDG
jgi:release factor glutamine methyltransferase